MTTRPGSETTTLQRGDLVRVQRDEKVAPSRGSWSRYRGRDATVVALNRQVFPSGVTYVEVGVHFGDLPETDDLLRRAAQSWFRADELTLRSCAQPPGPSSQPLDPPSGPFTLDII
jgi:hypothetical protein